MLRYGLAPHFSTKDIYKTLDFKDKRGLFGVTILFLWWVSTKSGKVTLVIALVTKYKNK